MGLGKNVEDVMDNAKDKQVARRRIEGESKADCSMRKAHHEIFWTRRQRKEIESRNGHSLRQSPLVLKGERKISYQVLRHH